MKRPAGFDTARASRARPKGTENVRPDTDDHSGPEPTTEPIDLADARRTEDPPVTPPPRAPQATAAPRPVAAVRRAVRKRRRVERGEVRRFTERSRLRRRAWIVSLGSIVVLVAVVAVIAVSPLLALRDIEIAGTSRVDAATLEHELDGQLGTPLPLLDYGRIDRVLAEFPLIRSYSTESRPPGTLVVRVVERSPIGVVEDADGYSLVDPAHVVISSSAEPPEGYPVIENSAGKRGFDAAVAVLLALPADFRSTIASVSASSTDDVTLRLTAGQSVVWGGPEDAALKAAVLDALLSATQGNAGLYDVSSPHAPVTR